MPSWRDITCIFLLLLLPASLSAQEGSAILHPQGPVSVNGTSIPATWTLSENDSVRVEAQATAQLDMSGSSVSVASDTLFSYEGNENELLLDHGLLQVNTSRKLKVRVGCVTVWPVNDAWTKYDVMDVNGRVKIVADQNDVYVQRGSATQSAMQKKEQHERTIVHQGEQATREEHCGAATLPNANTANGPLFDSLKLKLLGVAGAGALACVALCRSGDDPISPSRP